MARNSLPAASLFKGPDYDVIDHDNVGLLYRTRYTDDHKLAPKQQPAAGISLRADTTNLDAQVHIGYDQATADSHVTKTAGKAGDDDHSNKKLFGAVRTLQVRCKDDRAVRTRDWCARPQTGVVC
jgi:hypothetical protein